MRAQFLSHVWLFATPWTVALQAPLSVGLPRQEYWSRLPFPLPEDLPDLGIEPASLVSPALAHGFFTIVTSGNPAPTASFYPIFLFPLSICSVGALRPIQWTRHLPASGSWLGCFLCPEILSTKMSTWFMLKSPSGLCSNTTFTVRLSDHAR